MKRAIPRYLSHFYNKQNYFDLKNCIGKKNVTPRPIKTLIEEQWKATFFVNEAILVGFEVLSS